MARTVPIAVTGMHRSGTSMITRALHDSGLHLVGSYAAELIEAAAEAGVAGGAGRSAFLRWPAAETSRFASRSLAPFSDA